MKKFFLTLVLLLFSSTCFAVQIESAYLKNGPYYKIKRGFINVISSPLEIPKKIHENWQESGDHPMEKAAYVFGGTVKGLAWFAGRLGSGLWDILTPNIDIPKNEKPLMEPEYVVEK